METKNNQKFPSIFNLHNNLTENEIDDFLFNFFNDEDDISSENNNQKKENINELVE